MHDQSTTIGQAFLDYYRCPEGQASFRLRGPLPESEGYFRFGPNAVCYGRCSSGFRASKAASPLYDASKDVAAVGGTLQLPFSPSDIVANLRYERYVPHANGDGKAAGDRSAFHDLYYLIRPFLPVPVRKHLQRIGLRDWKQIPFPKWPVDSTVEDIFEQLLAVSLKAFRRDRVPFIWFWPNGYPGCAMMTHDVETLSGRNFCTDLMDLDDAFEIKSSFQIIPESRYPVSPSFLDGIRRRGFEVNVHDLNHDGHLFRNREQFLLRAERINRYGREFGASGFRSGVLYHNLEWYDALDFSYDMSVPSAGHLEPQRGGCCSVMPFFAGKMLELPVTTTQDYSLFHILNEYSIEHWKRQFAGIMAKHGLASFIVHPDYIGEPKARDTYESLLAYLAGLRSEDKVWVALPREINRWWRARSQMKLVCQGNNWVIEGPQKDKARVAYAVLDGDRLRYEFSSQPVLTDSNSGAAMRRQGREP